MPFGDTSSLTGFAVAQVMGRQQGVEDQTALTRIGIAGALLGATPIGIATTLVLVQRESADEAAAATTTAPPGPSQVEVPNVEGQPADQAEASLQAIGLRAQRREIDSTTTATGIVVSQAPEAPDSVAAGTTVTLRVSRGFAMPDVTGKTRDAAVRLLSSFFAQPPTIVVDATAAGHAPDTVIKQDPEAKARASHDGTVTLTVTPPPTVDVALVPRLNNIAPTVTEPVADYAARVQQPGALVAIWQFDAATSSFRAFSPAAAGAPGANTLDHVTRLQPVFVVVNANTVLRQPQA